MLKTSRIVLRHRVRFVVVLFSAAVLGPRLTDSRAADDDAKTKSRSAFELRDGDRVVLLGGTFIERAWKYGHLETAMTALYPNRSISFRNLGWSGDTVWAESRGIFDAPAVGYDRMIKQLQQLKPTVVIVAYGMNESHAGEPGYQKFRDQLDRLLDAIAGTGAAIAIVSPHRFEKPPAPLPDATALHSNLELYAAGLRQEATQRGVPFADLFRGYETDRPLTDNGIHFTSHGYRRISEVLLERFGVPFQTDAVSIRVKPAAATAPIRFQSTAKRLPWAGQTVRVSGLLPGHYDLKIDGKTVMTATATDFAAGLTVTSGPDVQQVNELRQAIIRKNRLYFYRWRPQNITYLFGFRKHEQGNNAKEVAEYEPLVREVEKEIARLKQPMPHTFEVVKAQGGRR